MVKTNNTKTACCSPRQKVYGIIALAGLFACGVMIGVTLNGGEHKKNAAWEKQCNNIAENIVSTSSKSYISSDDMARLEKLNEMYNSNCAGHTYEEKQSKSAPKPEDVADKKTCEVIEELLARDLADEDDNYPGNHQNNIDVYKKLADNGCPENTEKYQALIQREQEILAALTGNTVSKNTQTCAEIEQLLLQQVSYFSHDERSVDRIERAKVYANISERGCPENAQRYVDLAAKELEIARALQDDEFSDSDREQISDTYRRIKMKQAASDILNKVQKLADPAIDFFIQAQKIIEE